MKGAQLKLSFKMLSRELRSGQLNVLLIALIIAVTAATAVGLFGDRIEQAMGRQAAELLGADLVLKSARPVAPELLSGAETFSLKQTRTLQFPSVLVAGDNKPRFQLASIKAVASGYPLRGQVRTAKALDQPDTLTTEIPKPGELWLAPRLFGLLGVKVGDSIELGDIKLKVTRVLSFESDRAGGFYGLAPRALMALADVERANVLGVGSRVTWNYLFSGDSAAISAYEAWLSPRLKPSETLETVTSGRPALRSALVRAEQYLGLAGLVAVLLSGVAIAMGARHYATHHFDTCALLRCFGQSRAQALQLFLQQLLLLALFAGVIGLILGWLVHLGLLWLLAPLLPDQIPAATLTAWSYGLFTGFITLIGFAGPPLLQLGRVAPLRILRRELLPLPASGWLVYSMAIGTIFLLMLRYTNNIWLPLALLAGGLAIVMLAIFILASLLRVLLRPLTGRSLSLGWRFVLQRLRRQQQLTLAQLLAFALTLMAMGMVALVRTDLVERWQAQLPADTPNYFAINIQPAQVEGFNAKLADIKAKSSTFFPVVRGRLIAINEVPVQEAVRQDAKSDNAINRELNLTATAQLPKDNKLVSGQWWDKAMTEGHTPVSVETELAERLGIKLGDRLRFNIGGEPLEAKVTNLRSVEWQNFRPNFYMIFPEGSLSSYPTSWMTSFYLSPGEQSHLAELIRAFPAVTTLDVAAVIEQVRHIIFQLSLALEWVLLLVLGAGLAVMFAAMQASLDERLQEGALLRTLGASRRQLRQSQWGEFAALGTLAGLLALVGVQVMASLLYHYLFELDYQMPYWLLGLPLLGAALIGAGGIWGTRRVLVQPPVRILVR